MKLLENVFVKMDTLETSANSKIAQLHVLIMVHAILILVFAHVPKTYREFHVKSSIASTANKGIVTDLQVNACVAQIISN